MFDGFGRIICEECAGFMQAVTVEPSQAVFKCLSEDCARLVVIRWPGIKTPPPQSVRAAA